MLCKSCTDITQKVNDTPLAKHIGSNFHHSILCLNVHCDNVFDSGSHIKKKHKAECTDCPLSNNQIRNNNE